MPALNPTVRNRRLGVELRRFREGAGLTIEQVAARLECSISKVSRIETAQVRPTPRDVRDLLDMYGVEDDSREALLRIAREARQRGWWELYSDLPKSTLAGVESAADSIRAYSQALVPGLLQTEEYARAVIRAIHAGFDPPEIDRRVELRMARQQLLTRERPLRLWVVLDEAIARREVGGRDVLRRQLDHLATVTALRDVTIQVLPFRSGAHAAMDGEFAIIGFPERGETDITYIENATSDLYVEEADAVSRYIEIFDRVRDAALSPTASRAFLTRAARELSARA
jgi:transcriptional regulator with XRE-family HTH domain